MLSVRRECRNGGTRAGDDDAQGESFFACLHDAKESRCQFERSVLQIVCEGSAKQCGVARPERRHHSGIDLRVGGKTTPLGNLVIEAREHVSSGQALALKGEHPMELALRHRWRHVVASTQTECGMTEQGERHIRTKPRSKWHEIVPADAAVPRFGTRDERRGSIGTAARHTPRDGNTLEYLEFNALRNAVLRPHRFCGLPGEIAFVKGHPAQIALKARRRVHREADEAVIADRRRHCLVQIDRLEDGRERVIAVFAARANRELQIHLAGGTGAYAAACEAIDLRKGGHRSALRCGSASAIRAKSAMANCSPRVSGSMPA